ncbi:putative MFS transporter [Aspergillus granulosus]|uniref:MFS transporter n=1 Tax=Aspergillus granulosus TaxID=176169 RepID=A0ABR4H4H4_9EURO
MEFIDIPPSEAGQPPRLILKLMSASFAFFVAGINDGSLGPLIPYIRESYNINEDKIAIIYAATFCGWFVTALTNSYLAQYLDLGVFLVLGVGLQILAQALRAWIPPLPLFAVTFFLASLGQAYQDTHANTFVASVKANHRWLAFIHAMYMAGCLVGPFVATAVSSAGTHSQWNFFYLIPLGLGVANLALTLFTFHEVIRLKPVARNAPSTTPGAPKEMQKILASPGVWVLSLYFFFFLGAVITAGGWTVEYLIQVRNGDRDNMGYVAAGFSGGGLLGRLILAEPTHRFGERRMIFLYVLLCVALELVFWLVPHIITAAVAISLFGFFSGPFLATGVSVAFKMLTVDIRSSALAFIFVLGQVGGSLFPAITGIIASRSGVMVLQPMLVGLLGATGATWLLLPKTTAHED